MKKILLSCLALVAGSAMAITTDELAGYYTETMSITGDGTYVKSRTDYVDTVTISKIDESTVVFTGLMGTSEELTGILDATEGTITIAPQTIYSYYTFASNEGDSKPVIVKIEADKSLTISDGAFWYYSSAYGTSYTSKMIKYADNSIAQVFAADCTVELITYDENDSATVAKRWNSNIVKYTGGTYPYVLNDYTGSSSVLKFYEDADGNIITNGSVWYGWYYHYYQFWFNNDNDYLAFNPKNSSITEATKDNGEIWFGGWYYNDYDKDSVGFYIDLRIYWGDNYAAGINTVEAEYKQASNFHLNGSIAAKDEKGMIIRDRKVVFVK